MLVNIDTEILCWKKNTNRSLTSLLNKHSVLSNELYGFRKQKRRAVHRDGIIIREKEILINAIEEQGARHVLWPNSWESVIPLLQDILMLGCWNLKLRRKLSFRRDRAGSPTWALWVQSVRSGQMCKSTVAPLPPLAAARADRQWVFCDVPFI